MNAEKIICFVLVLLSYVLGVASTSHVKNIGFAETECAQYNPLTGDFEIINKTKETTNE